MAIKVAIELKAVKVGAAVRAALQEFAQTTGMQANVKVDWVTANTLDKASPDHYVGRLVIEVGGLYVEA